MRALLSNQKPLTIVAGVAVTVLCVMLLLWSIRHSGFFELFQGAPSNDPANLRGKTLPLAGDDAYRRGFQLSLDDFRGQHVLVVRSERKYSAWLIDALRRWHKNETRKVVLLAVFSRNDEDQPTWLLSSGLPFRGVLVDSTVMQDWGFTLGRAELRLIDTDGKVATVDLASDDRDETIVTLNRALDAAGVSAQP